jgi:hypothetical protein
MALSTINHESGAPPAAALITASFPSPLTHSAPIRPQVDEQSNCDSPTLEIHNYQPRNPISRRRKSHLMTLALLLGAVYHRNFPCASSSLVNSAFVLSFTQPETLSSALPWPDES